MAATVPSTDTGFKIETAGRRRRTHQDRGCLQGKTRKGRVGWEEVFAAPLKSRERILKAHVAK